MATTVGFDRDEVQDPLDGRCCRGAVEQALGARLYERMLLIRRFEERLLEAFSRGRLFGTTHAYIGQEANAVGLFDAIGGDDIIVSNHRCHGHFLAYGGEASALAAELMGKATGLCGGRGGSQHICWRNFYSNGVQGGIVPVATGMAIAEKAKRSGRMVVVFVGDGTMGEGAVYESLNIAALWSLPVLFVVENNRYAQTTPIALHMAGSISARFAAFAIPVTELATTDVRLVRDAAGSVAQDVRQRVAPHALVLNTYRLCPHSKGDDTRDVAELEAQRAFDPLVVHRAGLDVGVERDVAARVETLLDEAFTRAESAPFPTAAAL
jgi:TPP-dependent pyruvate/acetoin dehydrogenase alpha subunit